MLTDICSAKRGAFRLQGLPAIDVAVVQRQSRVVRKLHLDGFRICMRSKLGSGASGTVRTSLIPCFCWHS